MVGNGVGGSLGVIGNTPSGKFGVESEGNCYFLRISRSCLIKDVTGWEGYGNTVGGGEDEGTSQEWLLSSGMWMDGMRNKTGCLEDKALLVR